MSRANIRIGLVVACLIGGLYGRAQQPIHIKDGEFKGPSGAPFYSLCMTYVIQVMFKGGDPADPTRYYVAPKYDYGPYGYGCWECRPTTNPTCIDQIKKDFETIKAMGFNTVHVAGLNPTTRDLDDIDEDDDDREYRMNIPALAASGYWWENVSYDLNSTTLVDTDPILNMLFDAIDDVAAAAEEAGLQLMLDGQGNHVFTSTTAIQDYETYLTLLATHITANETPLMAYIVVGEPENGNLRLPGTGDNTKLEVCQATDRWYHALKDNDPDHLVGAGYLGIENIKAWDPVVMKMDFFFPHVYIDLKNYAAYEDVGVTGEHHNLTLALDRIYAEFYWMKQNSPVPWMLGETGFKVFTDDHYTAPTNCSSPNTNAHYEGGHDCSALSWDPALSHGDLADQQTYYHETLAMARNCGAVGYSVWEFQDNFNDQCSENFGLIESGSVNATNFQSFARPALAEFIDYLTGNEAPPPDELTEPPANYYDMCHTRAFSDQYFGTGTVSALTGTVVDQEGQPIANAMIAAKTNLTVTATIDENQQTHYWPKDLTAYTYTDAYGHFSVTPLDKDRPLDYQYIRWVVATAAGAAVEEVNGWGWDDMSIGGPDPPHAANPCNIVLPRVEPALHDHLDWFWLGNGQSLAGEAMNTLEVEGMMDPGSTGDFKAGQTVHTKDFHAVAGSEAHIYTEPVEVVCENIPIGRQLRLLTTDDPGPRAEQMRGVVNLSFIQAKAPRKIAVYPNPATDRILVDCLEMPIGQHVTVALVDLVGNAVRNTGGTGDRFTLDVRGLAQGLYLVQVSDGTNEWNERVLIHQNEQ